jgi:thymidylate kinase
MHIELIGCTSAGKTTLAKKIVGIGRQAGLDVVLGDDFVFERLHLSWIKNEYFRRRLLEIFAGYICLRNWRKYSAFRQFVYESVGQASGSLFYKANLVRIALRKIGIHELIRRSSSANQIVLVDNEGIVQAAHNLFVHTSRINGNLESFINAAPLPDVIAYLRQPQSVLLERTLRRGHPRIRKCSRSNVESFVKQANETFEKLQTVPEVAERSFVIDGESKALIKVPSRKWQFAMQACDLMKKGIKDDPSEKRSAFPDELRSGGLDLISRLAANFQAKGLSYCHWKSNINLQKSLEGKTDLDFLVSGESIIQLMHGLTQLGFKAAKIRYGRETPGVTHHYGLDIPTGNLVHVHLFTRLITGESFVKSHSLPFEEMLLRECGQTSGLQVVSKEAELVLFVLRLFVKYGSFLDIIRLYRESGDVRKELIWLLDGVDIAKALALLGVYCPTISESLFLNCVETIHEDMNLVKRLRLARKVKGKLRFYSEYSSLERRVAYGRVIIAKLKRYLDGNRKNKMLDSGGSVIAFVGADATGKSTLVAETEKWLGKVFAVRKVHVGKPPTTIVTFPFTVILPLMRRLLPRLRGGQIQSQERTGELLKNKRRVSSSLFYAVRALVLAWERHRLLRQVARARSRGELVICDRYPSEQTGAMDSPRLEERAGKRDLKASLYNWIARKEARLYEMMSPPDIVVNLKVSLETAKRRNQGRSMGERDTDEFVEARHRGVREWRREGTEYIFEIDTDQPMAATVLSIKKVIWESL